MKSESDTVPQNSLTAAYNSMDRQSSVLQSNQDPAVARPMSIDEIQAAYADHAD